MNNSTPQNPRYILVQEEYGYRHWIGVLPSDMTVESIIEWWKALPSVTGMFFNPSKSFPLPTLIELEDVASDDADRASWQWVDPDGQEHILDRSNVVLFAHVHMDDDSYLKIPKGETFHHAGYGEMPFADEDDEDEFDEPATEEQIREWASESELSRKVLQSLHPELKL